MLNKKIHGTGGDNFLYGDTLTYNERGWLKTDISNQFSLQLNYDDSEKPQFNGNISEQKWGTGINFPNVFNYEYDDLRRLVKANTTAGISMSEVLTYDQTGNIKSLSRDNGTAGTYEYLIGNRLNRIIAGPLASGVYQYDGNGNVTVDGRNGFTLTYNTLGLPKTAVGGSVSMAYTYDATGTKLRRVKNGSSRDYIDGIEYNGSVIDLIHTETGVARNNSGTYTYEHNLTDHLGNVRYTFNKHPTTGALQPLQADNYYAFGLRKSLSAGPNQYLYNGKELQAELGQLDYGARFYDPVVGRWSAIDPLAEQYRRWSPYNYTMNNPIRFIDPDGMSVETYSGLANATALLNWARMGAAMSDSDDRLKRMMGEESQEEQDERKAAEENKNKKNPWDEDGNNKLSLREANRWYRVGNGAKVTVDASSVDLSSVDPQLFVGKAIGSRIVVKLLASNFFTDGTVYGTLDLEYRGGKSVRILANDYDFDTGADKGHPWFRSAGGFLRNTLTEVASGLPTAFGIFKGNPFTVEFSGTANLRSYPVQSYDIDLGSALGF